MTQGQRHWRTNKAQCGLLTDDAESYDCLAERPKSDEFDGENTT
jgi:hypothetical protein